MATYSSIRYNFPVAAATTSTQVGAGAMVLIKSLTSDGSDDDLSFVDGTSDVVMDSTYRTYIFKFSHRKNTICYPHLLFTRFQIAGDCRLLRNKKKKTS